MTHIVKFGHQGAPGSILSSDMLVHRVKVIWAKDGDSWTTQGWEIFRQNTGMFERLCTQTYTKHNIQHRNLIKLVRFKGLKYWHGSSSEPENLLSKILLNSFSGCLSSLAPAQLTMSKLKTSICHQPVLQCSWACLSKRNWKRVNSPQPCLISAAKAFKIVESICLWLRVPEGKCRCPFQTRPRLPIWYHP